MFVFRKIWLALPSCYLRFEPFCLITDDLLQLAWIGFGFESVGIAKIIREGCKLEKAVICKSKFLMNLDQTFQPTHMKHYA